MRADHNGEEPPFNLPSNPPVTYLEKGTAVRKTSAYLLLFRPYFSSWCIKTEFRLLGEENASAPPGERLTEAEMLIDPGYDEMLDRQGKELCEEVGRVCTLNKLQHWCLNIFKRFTYCCSSRHRSTGYTSSTTSSREMSQGTITMWGVRECLPTNIWTNIGRRRK